MKIIASTLKQKAFLLLLIFLLLQIPIMMVQGLIDERAKYQDQVIEEIALSSTGEQNVVGPFLELTRKLLKTDKEGKTITSYHKEYLLPKNLIIDANVDTFEKYRSIYKARLYKAESVFKGEFDVSKLTNLDALTEVKLAVGIKDSRGIIELRQMEINHQAIEMLPGTEINSLSSGFHVILDPASLKQNTQISFDLRFLLQGMNQLNVLPTADNVKMRIASTWQHPSFVGKFLPIASTVSEKGFDANWSSNKFTSNIGSTFSNCMRSSNCLINSKSFMSVKFIEPVDHYLKAERSVDYSFLIIFLVFASFLLLEALQTRPIHPIQYAFAGLAAAIFYLLLISFSEHLGFDLAYLLSATASISLLSLYAGNLLNKRIHKVLYFIALAFIYAVSFGMLQAESYALLIGTVICFAMLSTVMLLTRNVDWYLQNNKLQQSIQSSQADTE